MYWVDNNHQGNACEISNCSGTQKALPGRSTDRLGDLGADADALYLLTDSSATANTAASAVWKLAK